MLISNYNNEYLTVRTLMVTCYQYRLNHDYPLQQYYCITNIQ